MNVLHPRDSLQDGRLACSILSDHHKCFTLAYCEREVIDKVMAIMLNVDTIELNTVLGICKQSARVLVGTAQEHFLFLLG